jgi:3-isopropylmalate/(R)-2-methylmalate dehydratase small subunit
MKNKIKGRVLFIVGSNSRLIDNIDTDQIFHNSHLAVTDITKMGEFTFGNLLGWDSFPNISKPGDIIVAGNNFGSGSSRQQAVDCFRSLKIQAIIAKSFGAIYKRNAINSGFCIIESYDLDFVLGELGQDHSKENILVINLEENTLLDNSKKIILGKFKQLSKVQKDIYEIGDLFKFGKSISKVD